VGCLDHDARAVTGRLLRARGTAVFEVLQQFQPIREDPVPTVAVEVHHDPDAAVGPCVGRVRQPVVLIVTRESAHVPVSSRYLGKTLGLIDYVTVISTLRCIRHLRDISLLGPRKDGQI
jgi:hypothetical protein